MSANLRRSVAGDVMFCDRTGSVRPKGGSAFAVESFGSSFFGHRLSIIQLHYDSKFMIQTYNSRSISEMHYNNSIHRRLQLAGDSSSTLSK
jgi:hypothetical protein